MIIRRAQTGMQMVFIALAAAAVSSTNGHAAVLYDNLGHTPYATLCCGPSDSLLAQQFLTGEYDAIASITRPLWKSGTPTGLISFEIWNADANGLPGEAVASLGSIDVSTLSTEYSLVTHEGPFTGLEKNTPYFYVNNISMLNHDRQNPVMGAAVSSDAGTFGAAKALVTTPDWTPLHELGGPPFSYLQMRVTAVPEPSSWLLLMGASFGVALRKWRCSRPRH